MDEADNVVVACLSGALETVEERVETPVAEVEPTAVAGELDAQGTEVLDCARRLRDSGIDVWQRHDGAEAKAVGMACDHAGGLVVEGAAKVG